LILLGRARAAAFRSVLAFDDGAERRHALRIQFDIESGQVEADRFDDLDLAAAVAVARHDIDVAIATGLAPMAALLVTSGITTLAALLGVTLTIVACFLGLDLGAAWFAAAALATLASLGLVAVIVRARDCRGGSFLAVVVGAGPAPTTATTATAFGATCF
jgi:VIT1/CCC1 family predicted Fe2+/Mn2+ transporter